MPEADEDFDVVASMQDLFVCTLVVGQGFGIIVTAA
jgi:hypothetical protein